MSLRRLLPLAALLGCLSLPAAAGAASYEPGEVIVKYGRGASHADRRAAQVESGTGRVDPLPGGSRKLEILDGESVRETVSELERDPDVKYAVPNYLAHKSAYVPNDPGVGEPGDWPEVQWNFAGPAGINAPDAWDLARQAGAPGGRGAVVAVLDTGVAYVNRGRYRRAPDLHPRRFVRGYDYVADDRYPNDLNGHGTHVAGTIAQRTNNSFGVTGLAYGVKIMPVRVLDTAGDGRATWIARAIRFAARNKADVINMSFEFDSSVHASEIPDVLSAIRYAHKRGVVVVAAAGNQADTVPAYPARNPRVISVGATTEHGCVAEYSNGGRGLDISAPGGGYDADYADNPRDAVNCNPDTGGSQIVQVTFSDSIRKFGLAEEEGTSMASPHVSAVAALLIATHRLGRSPSPAAIEARLEQTARDLGPTGFDTRYGAGLVDAAAALR